MNFQSARPSLVRSIRYSTEQLPCGSGPTLKTHVSHFPSSFQSSQISGGNPHDPAGSPGTYGSFHVYRNRSRVVL